MRGNPVMGTRGWFQRSSSSFFEVLLVEGNLVERSYHNFLSDTTVCFQLATVFQFDIQLSHFTSAKFCEVGHPDICDILTPKALNFGAPLFFFPFLNSFFCAVLFFL